MDTRIDPNGLEVLTRPECFALLARHALGRVSVSIGALPVIVPVTYRLTGDAIVLRTTPSRRFDAALRHAVVAFEVDDLDEVSGAGWSVMVTGLAEEIVGSDELDWAHTLGLRSWAGGAAHFVRIPCDEISGRRIAGWEPTDRGGDTRDDSRDPDVRGAPGPDTARGDHRADPGFPATTPQIHSRF
jgi:hypothetical protein